MTLAVRDDLENELNWSTVKSKPLALTRNEALRNIDAAILRLIPDQTLYGKEMNYVVSILPSRDGNAENHNFEIVAITQGIYGTVTLKNDGTVNYRPDSNLEYIDKFKITLKNRWGSVAEKTITIDRENK